MKNFIFDISMIVVIISVITFLVGFFMVFIESKRKLALKILLLSVIGFSTCVATL